MLTGKPSRPAPGVPVRLVPAAVEPPPPMAPDPDQQRVLEHSGGPLLVLAGPGTGKTATLTELLARRVAAGVDPARLLLLTFSRRAAAELGERLAQRLAGVAAPPAAWTFHAYAYALLRTAAGPGAAPRLRSGPAQDLVVRDMLRGEAAEHAGRWPRELRPALATRGFAREVAAALARARELALDPADVAALGQRHRRPDWVALAGFYADYLDVLDAQNLLDYAELVRRAVTLLEDAEARARVRASVDLVVVDEYQDTDHGQERLLHALAGDGRDLVVVGDPDQAIYGFRGADVGNLLRFPDRFRGPGGAPAPVLTLRRSRRSGPSLLAATRRVAWRLPAPGLPAEKVRRHRDLVPAPDLVAAPDPVAAPDLVVAPDPDQGTDPATAARAAAGPTSVRVLVYGDELAEADGIADVLRAAHLRDRVPWASMAVLVRSARRSVPVLVRALGAAGVPVHVPATELPLAGHAGVAALLLGLRCAAEAEALTPPAAQSLLAGPLVRADAGALRRLVRALREAAEPPEPTQPGTAPPPRSAPGELLCRALREPGRLDAVPAEVSRPARALLSLLAAARDELGRGGLQEALWQLWSGSGLPELWSQAALAGGVEARPAALELDAVVALFDVVERHVAEHPGGGVALLLADIEARELPDTTSAPQRPHPDAVRLLTAHRSKGLEWDLVVVAGVQEGGWPDLRPRGGLLAWDRLEALAAVGSGEPSPAAQVAAAADRSEMLAEERRLFYVAITRARHRLVVTAVDGDDATPSRFLEELGVALERPAAGADPGLRLPRLVAQLRRTLVDPATPEPLARAAAQRLARLAGARGPDGALLVPAAHPDRWWGRLPRTRAPLPPYPQDRPVPLSATTVGSLAACPLRWFLRHEVGVSGPAGAALQVGRLLHLLADDLARGRRAPDPEALARVVARALPVTDAHPPWCTMGLREQAADALARFLVHVAATGRELVGSEVSFDVVVELPSGPVRLRGALDRVEATREGGCVVVDLKTGSGSLPSAAATDEDVQLGLYQLLLARHQLPGVQGEPAGAELWYLRSPAGAGPAVRTQAPLDADRAARVAGRLDAAASLLRAEEFPATPGEHCRGCEVRTACPAVPDGRPVVP